MNFNDGSPMSFVPDQSHEWIVVQAMGNSFPVIGWVVVPFTNWDGLPDGEDGEESERQPPNTEVRPVILADDGKIIVHDLRGVARLAFDPERWRFLA